MMANRNWASLPSPLLRSIAERLTPEAYARLRAVCTVWASAVSPEEWEEGQQQPYYLPRSPYCPWLLVPSDQDESTSSRTFLSLPESLRPYRIAAPDLHDKHIVGSYAAWVAAVDTDCNAYLINPLTRAQIRLPPITTTKIPGVHPLEVIRDPSTGSPIEFITYCRNNIVESYTPEEFRLMYFQKIVLSASPSSSPDDFIVVIMFNYSQWLAFARAGDTAWSVLDRLPPDNYSYKDVVFCDQKLYALSHHGQIDVFDFTQTEPQPTMLAECISKSGFSEPRYLVFSSGELLLLTRIKQHGNLYKTSGFIVEKLDLAEEHEKRRVHIHDLGCRSIFIGTSQSISISTQETAGVRHNCIYFTDDYYDWFFGDGKQCTRDLGVFDVKEGSCEPLYPPLAWLTWPPPIWFAPF